MTIVVDLGQNKQNTNISASTKIAASTKFAAGTKIPASIKFAAGTKISASKKIAASTKFAAGTKIPASTKFAAGTKNSAGTKVAAGTNLHIGPRRQSVTCLATDACLTADPGVPTLIAAWSHTFMEIDREIISTGISLSSAISFKRSSCQFKAKVCARSTGLI